MLKVEEIILAKLTITPGKPLRPLIIRITKRSSLWVEVWDIFRSCLSHWVIGLLGCSLSEVL
jgi:hypothetical protein